MPEPGYRPFAVVLGPILGGTYVEHPAPFPAVAAPVLLGGVAARFHEAQELTVGDGEAVDLEAVELHLVSRGLVVIGSVLVAAHPVAARGDAHHDFAGAGAG